MGEQEENKMEDLSAHFYTKQKYERGSEAKQLHVYVCIL